MTSYGRLEEVREHLSQLADPIELLVGLFDHAPIGLQLYRADGQCILSNQACRDIFGAEPPPDYNVLADQLLVRGCTVEPPHRAFAGETVTIPAMWYDTPEQPLRRGAGR